MIRALAGLGGLVAGYAVERRFLQSGDPGDGLLVWSTVVASLGVGGLAYAAAALLTDDGGADRLAASTTEGDRR